MTTISLEEIEEELKILQSKKRIWIDTGLDERIAILDEVKKDFLIVSEQWVRLCTKEKGIPPDTFGEVFEWNMLQAIFSLLASLRQSMTDINKYGRPQIAGPIVERSDGQVTATVFPRTRLESMLFSNLSMEVWMLPGVSIDELNFSSRIMSSS
jgi:hypothetical protein